VFALEFQGSDENTRRSYFFLEADRGTMPVTRKTLSQTSFHRTLVAYEAIWIQPFPGAYGDHRPGAREVFTNRVHSIENRTRLVPVCRPDNFGKFTGHPLALLADRQSRTNRHLVGLAATLTLLDCPD